MRAARPVRGLALGILLAQGLHPASAAAPDAAAAPAPAPAWAAESPQAAGAWIALGLDGVYASQSDLQISAATTTTTLLDAQHGTGVTTAVNDDPALLNRKFVLHWRAGPGAGAQVPIALPRLPLAGLAIYPTLVLQGAWSGWRLGLLDRPEPADSTTVTGQGAVLGLGLDLTAPLCRGCPWFGGAGFRVHTMPSVAAGRAPAIAAVGFEVPENQTRFRMDGGEGLVRIGRSLAGGRIAPYLGLLRRRDWLTLDDTVALRSEVVAEETLLHTRTGIVASGTAGIAGVGVRLAGPLLVRLETGFGDRLFTLSMKISHLGLVPRPPGARGAAPEASENPRASERSQEEVGRQLLPALELARTELRRTASELGIGVAGPPSVGYTRQQVSLLLDAMERQLVAALAGPELAAMRDYVHDLVGRARADIAAIPSAAAGAPPAARLLRAVSMSRDAAPAPVPGAPAAAVELLPAAAGRPSPEHLAKAAVDGVLARIWDAIDTLRKQAKAPDLRIDLCVTSVPKGAVFQLSPVSFESWREVRTNGVLQQVWRGAYQYKAIPNGKQLEPATDRGKFWLDLVDGSPRVVECHFSAAVDPTPGLCAARAGAAGGDCAP